MSVPPRYRAASWPPVVWKFASRNLLQTDVSQCGLAILTHSIAVGKPVSGETLPVWIQQWVIGNACFTRITHYALPITGVDPPSGSSKTELEPRFDPLEHGACSRMRSPTKR
jgi:hypothetical protein